MSPADAPSPTGSTAAAKRSRASGSAAPASARSNKRKKPEGSVAPPADDKGRPAFGVGMVKGREDEWTEPGDVKTKINFLDLPVEALYKYLEANDLVPRWDPSPWSEAPCEPPMSLYHNYPQAPGVIVGASPPPPPEEPTPEEPKEDEGEYDPDDPDAPIRPTTRSKTAPQRKRTPEPASPRRGVFTLSDIHACRAIMAEKANQHWMKGLGGGQNREGETIVNFLYKNKVGHGRLLRVYNPTPAPFS